MHPKSNRRTATRASTSHVLLATALAAGLSFAPLGGAATAQPGGHPGHEGHGAKKPLAVKGAPGHAGHGPASSDAPAVGEYKAAHASMMRGMTVRYTGDPDVDFRIQMIPHHEGAIDMARVAMRHAKDPWTRQLAESVIIEQQREIAEMQGWLQRHGVKAPPTGQPLHVMSADSVRTVPEEPGTRAELRGQSWAPGSGIPASR